MNLGIGVCIGDVSFTNRHHNNSTNTGNSAQRIRERQNKNISNKEYNNKKVGRQVSPRQHRDSPHVNERLHQTKKVPSTWRSETTTHEKDASSSTKSGARYIYVSGDTSENRKSENEYSSTPSRASLQRCAKEGNKQLQEEEVNIEILDPDTHSNMEMQKTNDFLRNEKFSKSKWQLVAERLMSKRPNTVEDKQKPSTLNLSPKLNTSYQPRNHFSQDQATEERTNPHRIPPTLFDPSVFYITASKFCPCDHHDQLRKIQEHKISLARKARRKAERLKRKELRRKRKAASLTLSRSSSGSISSHGNYVGKRASTVDILPSIPSLNFQSIEVDQKENNERQCRGSSVDQCYQYEGARENLESITVLNETKTIPRVVISKCSSPVSSESTEPNGLHKTTEVASRVLEPVILDGCDSNSIQNNDKQTTTGFKNETTKFGQHKKLSRETGNWTLKSLSSEKHETKTKKLEDIFTGYATTGKQFSRQFRNDKQTTAIHHSSVNIKTFENNEGSNTIDPTTVSPEAILPVNSSKPSKIPTHLAFEKEAKAMGTASFQKMKQKPFNDCQQERRPGSRAWIRNITPDHPNYPYSQNSFYPNRGFHTTPNSTHPPRTLSEFNQFSGHRQQFFPYTKPIYGRSQHMSNQGTNNYLLHHYTASPVRRNSECFPPKEQHFERARHFSDSPSRPHYSRSLSREKSNETPVPPHYLQQIQCLNQLQQMFETENDRREHSPSISISISTSSLSDASSENSSLQNWGEDKEDHDQSDESESRHKHRHLSTQISHNTYQHGTQMLRQSVSNSHPFVMPQLPQCIQNIILQHHWHLTRAPHIPEAKEKHLKKLSKHILLPDDPEDPAAFTISPELTRPPRKPWCSSKPVPKIVGTFAFLMTCGIIVAILYANYSSNIFKPMT